MFATAALLLCVVLQDPTPPPAPDPAPTPEAAPEAAPAPVVVKNLTNDEARTALAEFKKQYQPGAKLAPKMQAVAALGESSHPTLVKPLVGVVLKDDKLTVRRAAAQALAHQPAKQLRQPLLKLLTNKSVQREPQVVVDLIGALEQGCYEAGKDWKLLDDMFEADFSEAHRPKQKAILSLVKRHKDPAAVPLLLRHLDEPAPEDPHAQSNPPAEYWEARWKSWRAWKTEVKAALYEITGQQFNAAEEARAWLQKNRPKLGR